MSGLKVTLNLADDAELRNFIKDMIRGQVKSVVRDELKLMVKDITTEEVNKVVANQLGPIVRNELSSMRSAYGTANKLDVMIKESVKEHCGKLADAELEERIYQKALGVLSRDTKAQKELTQKMVDEAVRGFFSKLTPS